MRMGWHSCQFFSENELSDTSHDHDVEDKGSCIEFEWVNSFLITSPVCVVISIMPLAESFLVDFCKWDFQSKRARLIQEQRCKSAPGVTSIAKGCYQGWRYLEGVNMVESQLGWFKFFLVCASNLFWCRWVIPNSFEVRKCQDYAETHALYHPWSFPLSCSNK